MAPTLLVLAAGMGSRYGGVKQIDSVGQNGECLLDYSTYDAKRAGFGKVVYIIRKDIESDFRTRLFDTVAKNFNAEYVFQESTSLLTSEQCQESRLRQKPWGTCHAVLCAKDVLKEPFCVINSDDYYGKDAFETIAHHLNSIDAYSSEHAMVGYTLRNTMSTSGSVSRGLCKVQDGKLLSIEENLKIYYRSDVGSQIVSEMPYGTVNLLGDECTSMNFFGFSLKALQTFTCYWEDFLKHSLSSQKDEALLPLAATAIIKKGEGVIKYFASQEKWFGMTYPGDRVTVKNEILKKILQGYYPQKLWQ